MVPKLLVLSVSAGAGHVRAAEALVAAAHARGWSAQHIDVMELVPRLFRRLYAGSFITLVNRSPALWGYLYHASDVVGPDTYLARFRRAIEELNTRRLARAVHQAEPTHIVCTHFLPAQLCARLRAAGVVSAPITTVVTDYDVHALWVQPGQAGFCVAAEEVAWRLDDRLAALPGAPPVPPIAVTGIPIASGFAAPPSRAEAAARFGIDAQRTTLLLMSGAAGVGAMDKLAERMLHVPGDFQIMALAGRNAPLLDRLGKIAARFPGRLFPVGFTEVPEAAMAASDLAITKPGGLTTAECLALGLPMLVVSPIPGQEERNSDYLLEHSAAMKAHDAAGVEYRVRRLLADPDRLARMRAAAPALGRPLAADAVLDQVMAASPSSSAPNPSV